MESRQNATDQPPPGALGTAHGVARETFEAVFRCPLSVWTAGLLLATLNILLFAYEKPWTAAEGLRNWGDWLFRLAGGNSPLQLLPPWLFSGSVLNFGLVAGALTSALLSRQFAVRIAPPREFGKAVAGGVLMGLGATVAIGCNIGGFYSALSAFSLAGPTMMVGLALGAWGGARYLLWESRRPAASSKSLTRSWWAASAVGPSLQPRMGVACLALLALVVAVYAQQGLGQRGGLLLFGALFGIILQRSRFCLVGAFREPFLSGGGEMTRAAALSLGVSTVGFAVLKSSDLRSTDAFVFPAFWQGSLVGGVLFGVGMVLAGGCGVGSLWRAGEGHVKLWAAVAGFAGATSLSRRFLEERDWLTRLGRAVFLPDWTGWPLALALMLAVVAGWYFLAGWNEKAGRLATRPVEDTCP